MKQSFYLAYRYLTFHRFRTLVLVIAIGLIIFLPVGLERLITDSEKEMMLRAESFPLIIGAKGSSTDLVINAIYFQQEDVEMLNMEAGKLLNQTQLGYTIPLLTLFKARDFPIVGTNLDYFEFRNLEISEGRNLLFLGECVIGSSVAEQLDLHPGDSLISSPENYFDMAGVYPLKMEIVGVLKASGSADDKAVFTDLKTNWIIMDLGHGHQDVVGLNDPTLVLQKDSLNTRTTSKLFLYNKIDGKNVDSFHFHGDMDIYPVSAFVFVPDNEKSSAIIRGRFEAGELAHQIIVPTKVVDHLLQNIFRIKYIFKTVFVLVGVATLLILIQIVMLSLRLRKNEIHTMFTIGSSKNKVIEILGTELFMLILISSAVATLLFYITGFFVNDFIHYFIL